jgi:hypothetical protein
MNAPYDHAALWIKAKLFINRAMDDDECRTFDEQCLWASLALELLAKAALARISPLLIAEPTEDGTNLLIATGLMEGDARFTSVRAKTLFTRCQRAFKPFSSTEAMAIINGRNEYLHSSGVGFTTIPPQAWWPRFWAQAAILVSALDRDMDGLVGHSRETVVEDHLAQNTKNVEHQTEALIERAKQRLSQHRGGTLSARVAAEWKPGMDLKAGLSHGTFATCPACQSAGYLEGGDVIDTEVRWEEINKDEAAAFVIHTIGSDYFSCGTCQLVLDRYELIEQAGLPTDFDVEGSFEDVYDESEYGND